MSFAGMLVLPRAAHPPTRPPARQRSDLRVVEQAGHLLSPVELGGLVGQAGRDVEVVEDEPVALLLLLLLRPAVHEQYDVRAGAGG